MEVGAAGRRVPERRAAEASVGGRVVAALEGRVGVLGLRHGLFGVVQAHVVTDAGDGLDRDEVAVRAEPEHAARGHHEQPGTPLGPVDDEVVHLADPVTVRVEDDKPADVVALVGQGDLTFVESEKVDGERGHGASSERGRSIVPGACDRPRPDALQFRDNGARGIMTLMATRLLVLEDEDGLRASLRLMLESDGYEVVEASDAETALELVPGAGFDLMLVDLMLGGMDGFSFIRRARPMTEAPIVVISARDGVEDIVSALEAGADDYITKPFDVQEVRARLRAMLRRPVLSSDAPADGTPSDAARGNDVFVLDQDDGPLVFDRGAAQLTRGHCEIHLTMTEYRLLSVMAENSGRVLSRSSLLEHVWEEGFFGDERIVDVHVRRLRKKLERDPSTPRTLVTVRGLGYRLDTQ